MPRLPGPTQNGVGVSLQHIYRMSGAQDNLRGGVSREGAEMVYRDIRVLYKLCALEWDAAVWLSELHFLLFMLLLMALKRGRPLPLRLGLRQDSAFVANMSCGS